MNDSHRQFLQSFLSRGILSGPEVKDLYKLICQINDIEYSVNNLVPFVVTINSHIKPYHMEIKKGISEHDETNFYCLVNLEQSDISRMASAYSATELEFFKKIMEEVVCSGSEGSVSSMEALNLVESLNGKALKKNEAEALIDRLCKERWLCENEGQIMLTPRTIMEFDQYIQTQYPSECVLCELCKKLVVKGQNCGQCPVRFHIYCAKSFFKPESAKCTQCKEEWPHDVTRSEKRRASGRVDVVGEQSSTSARRS